MKHAIEGGSREIFGTYFIDNDAISINLDDDAPMTWRYKFSDGALIITYDQGGKVKIDRTMAKFVKDKK